MNTLVTPAVHKREVRPLYDTSVVRFKEWTRGGTEMSDSWHAHIATLYGVVPATLPARTGVCFVACLVCHPDEADVFTYGASQCMGYIFDP